MKDKSKKKFGFTFWLGILILIILFISYFIKIEADEGYNYIVNDSLLGIIILHNPFILGLYILIGFVCIANRIKDNWNKHNN